MPSPPTDFRLALLLLALALGGGPATAEQVRILIQRSPLAGSQYYAVAALRSQMRVGDALSLIREADNAHDPHAIRVEWQGHKLGYVPRRENRALAAALDAGDRVVARIKALREHRDPWRRVEFEVYIVL